MTAQAESISNDTSGMRFELLHGFLVARLPLSCDPDGKTIFTLDQASEYVGADPKDLEELWNHSIAEGMPRPYCDCPPAVESALNDMALRRCQQHLPEEFYQQFVHQCHAGGIDPWIYGLRPRVSNNARTKRKRLAIRITIGLMRSFAACNPRYLGQRGPLYRCEDGSWTDTWLRQEYPTAARVGIALRGDVEPLWSVATWMSHAPLVTDKKGKMTLRADWERRPAEKLGEVAEHIGLLRAFGDPLGNIFAKTRRTAIPIGPAGHAARWKR